MDEKQQAKKQVTHSSLTATIIIAIIVCLFTAGISYSHFMDAGMVEDNEGELLGQYLAAISSGIFSFVCLIFVVRTWLIKLGKIKVDNLEIISK